jgi:hypothetical protein
MDDECGAVVVVVLASRTSLASEYEAPEAAASDMDEEFDVAAPVVFATSRAIRANRRFSSSPA